MTRGANSWRQSRFAPSTEEQTHNAAPLMSSLTASLRLQKLQSYALEEEGVKQWLNEGFGSLFLDRVPTLILNDHLIEIFFYRSWLCVINKTYLRREVDTLFNQHKTTLSITYNTH